MQAHPSRVDKATRAVGMAAARANACPARPRFHFLPPSGWMNDPNGTFCHDGVYHLFYQHNPYRARWGRIHWGHARSEDLLHWEHLPVALAPEGGLRERHCFSGCCAVADDGTPTILYTSIGLASLLSMARRWAVQRAAFGDTDLVEWHRPAQSTVLREADHGGERIRHWRDPYVFTHAGRHYLLLAGSERGRPSGSVLLYRSADLLAWQYRGRLCLGDPSLRQGIECPNYFPLDGRWVLLVSPFGPVRYSVGDFEDEKHVGGAWRAFDHGRAFYATNTFVDGRGRTVVVGWVRGPRGDGWAGCLSLPREVRLGGDGTLSIEPVAELESLRREHRRIEACFGADAEPGADVSAAFPDAQIELRARYELAGAGSCGFEIRNGAEGHRFTIDLHRNTLTSGTETAPWEHPNGGSDLEVHAFLDTTVLEVFVNGSEAFTAVLAFVPGPPDPVEIVPFVTGGTASVQADLWSLKRI